MAKCRPVKCCVSPFFLCVLGEADVCVYIRWTGRGRLAADACTGAKVQNSTDGTCSGRESCPPSAIGSSPAEQPPLPPAPPVPSFCLTTAESDPFYLFIYLLNYSLIPSLVWPFNDPPGGTGEMERLLQGQMTGHLLGK